MTATRDVTAIVRELFDAIDAGEFARVAALLDDRFALHYNGVPDPISREVLLEMLRGYLDSFPDMRHEIETIHPSGDFVTVRLVVHATHRGPYEGIAATGRQVAVGAIHILRLAGGTVVEWWAAEDDLGLLRQLGAVVTPPSDV